MTNTDRDFIPGIYKSEDGSSFMIFMSKPHYHYPLIINGIGYCFTTKGWAQLWAIQSFTRHV